MAGILTAFHSGIAYLGKWNADQRLAEMLVAGAEFRMNPSDILTFLRNQGWSKSEQGNHLTHALSMVRASRADLYTRAHFMFRQIYTAL